MGHIPLAYPVPFEPVALPTIIPGSAKFRHSSFETSISFDRDDGTQVTLTITHPISAFPDDVAELVVGVYRKGQDEPLLFLCLPMAEVRQLQNLLNRHEVADYLDEEEE